MTSCRRRPESLEYRVRSDRTTVYRVKWRALPVRTPRPDPRAGSTCRKAAGTQSIGHTPADGDPLRCPAESISAAGLSPSAPRIRSGYGPDALKLTELSQDPRLDTPVPGERTEIADCRLPPG